MTNALEANKQAAIAFLKMAFIDKKPAEAIHRYVGDHYKQHNPLVPDGKEGVLAYAQRRVRENPDRTMNFVRVIAEADYVVLHIQHIFAATDQAYAQSPHGMAGIDIFRFEDGKIVEHWDVLQNVPAEAVHGNTMY